MKTNVKNNQINFSFNSRELELISASLYATIIEETQNINNERRNLLNNLDELQVKLLNISDYINLYNELKGFID